MMPTLTTEMRYCSIHKIEYFADCPQCEYDADLADTPHPNEYYEQPEWSTYAEDFDYDDG